MLKGIWIPLVTPFRDGRLDLAALEALTASYLDTGIAGFVALGTTAEAALLDDAERAAALKAITGVAAGRLPVFVGVGGISTRDFVDEIDRLELQDVAGYLVPPPAYLCPSQAGLLWHFGQIAARTRRPVMLYDVPHRCGVTIEPATVAQLACHPNLVGIKECVPAHFEALRATPLEVLCGTDDAFARCLAAGGAGGVLASVHVCADLFVEVQQLHEAGRVTEAQSRFDAMQPVLRLLFSAPNPAAIKAMLSCTHGITAEVRMPITPASPPLVAELRRAQATLERLRAERPAASRAAPAPAQANPAAGAVPAPLSESRA
ncbi:dihydrodipicolinate synthase family protein [Burkholderia plantarii]|uniref:dihydrodipicolinate synthase family protein n=1 Tax=Burkholderia plantarii TaxID=41899 RepID=UPI0007062C98|nr:dihydrodipicolinate synthase family protein [Burkholderia plantarii]ALK33218.1 Putative dihydrodipicolinate synthase [Burkholderia plantarii]GLZ22939.1 4-hydroxy-tetrahydrodipicolinate synthase [Burkholderia plantarii]